MTIRDDDHLYRLGMFYLNPDDTSLLVEKRVGVGVDFNYGHPAGKVIGAIITVLVLGTVVMLVALLVASG